MFDVFVFFWHPGILQLKKRLPYSKTKTDSNWMFQGEDVCFLGEMNTFGHQQQDLHFWDLELFCQSVEGSYSSLAKKDATCVLIWMWCKCCLKKLAHSFTSCKIDCVSSRAQWAGRQSLGHEMYNDDEIRLTNKHLSISHMYGESNTSLSLCHTNLDNHTTGYRAQSSQHDCGVVSQ